MTAWKIGNKEKAIVHIAKQQLGMTEAEYRAALKKVGVGTSKDLSYPQYNKLLRQFQADGFVMFSKKKVYNKPPGASWDKEPMLKKIGAILADLDLRWRYADGIARQMYGIDAVSWCTPEQLHGVVAALERHRSRALGGKRKNAV